MCGHSTPLATPLSRARARQLLHRGQEGAALRPAVQPHLCGLRLTLRSANRVKVEINGRAVAILPQYFTGDVARFEAGADGILRREAPRDATRPEQTPVRPPG